MGGKVDSCEHLSNQLLILFKVERLLLGDRCEYPQMFQGLSSVRFSKQLLDVLDRNCWYSRIPFKVLSCPPKTTFMFNYLDYCGKLNIDLGVYDVLTRDFETNITSLDRTKYPDGTFFNVQFKDATCGSHFTNFTCVGDSWEGELLKCGRLMLKNHTR
jgi:hypothetical protein